MYGFLVVLLYTNNEFMPTSHTDANAHTVRLMVIFFGVRPVLMNRMTDRAKGSEACGAWTDSDIADGASKSGSNSAGPRRQTVYLRD